MRKGGSCAACAISASVSVTGSAVACPHTTRSSFRTRPAKSIGELSSGIGNPPDRSAGNLVPIFLGT
ncbi:hypothetical protein NK6_1680 [Bradyrhizobium diazoefficiens]|uniref:Secreted protein n=1 Tax=Bradyrhizobium diazoefficiens TaxID=1355477 RepID=A0A0E4BL15_9BRAD|nr:hypothetical protein NK6_1680 [Bradyrhizobium diazoefficiens]